MKRTRSFIALCLASLFAPFLAYTQSNSAPLVSAKTKSQTVFEHKLEGTDTAQWHRIDPNVLPQASASSAEKIQFKLKLLDMMSFCTGDLFSTLSEVDAQEYLNIQEKKFCKERLKKLQPELQ